MESTLSQIKKYGFANLKKVENHESTDGITEVYTAYFGNSKWKYKGIFADGLYRHHTPWMTSIGAVIALLKTRDF